MQPRSLSPMCILSWNVPAATDTMTPPLVTSFLAVWYIILLILDETMIIDVDTNLLDPGPEDPTNYQLSAGLAKWKACLCNCW